MQHPVIHLTDEQYTYVDWVAHRRQDTAPLRQAHGCEGGYEEHLLGALGEMAFGIWLYGDKKFELTIGTYRRQPDFPDDTEVRTRREGHYKLNIRPDDDPAAAFVLAVPYGSSGRAFRLPGWLWAHQARRDEWFDDYGNGREKIWFVPQDALYPMEVY